MNLLRYGMAALFGVVLLSSQAAADPKDDVTKTVEKLEAAVKKLQDVERSLTDYKSANAAAIRQIQDDIDGLKIRIRQIEDDVRVLRQSSGTQGSISRREAYDLGMGRVRLSNEYLEEMSVVLNGATYRLLPGQTRTIQVPAGLFTYQVLNLQPTLQQRTIEPGEEKPIRIFTQR